VQGSSVTNMSSAATTVTAATACALFYQHASHQQRVPVLSTYVK
jgi:hypothetical protein